MSEETNIESQVVVKLEKVAVKEKTRKPNKREEVLDVVTVGDASLFQLLCQTRSTSQGWSETTKAMEVPTGCVVQVATHDRDSETLALVFVPGVRIVEDVNGGRRLVKSC